MNRRDFVAGAGLAAAGLIVLPPSARAAPPPSFPDWLQSRAFDDFVRAQLKSAFDPGLSLGIVYDRSLLRTEGYGWANIAARRPMRANTLLNIASVTKTITCTAVMQLAERGKVRLDDDVNRYLPFQVRNPAHPEVSITVRQLLTHTSSITDGPAYQQSYACGDPRVSLNVWLRSYLLAGGANYDAAANFGVWQPGEQWSYSNVAFGLLGLVIETVSRCSYMDYCIRNIFRPLGMTSSRFLLAGMRPEAHATPYTYVTDGDASAVPLRDPRWSPPPGEMAFQVPHCLYSFATPPDGLARTSAAELSRFLLAYMRGGMLDGYRLLRFDTVNQILNDQHVPFPGEGGVQGLAWVGENFPGAQGNWNHSGGDPGVTTHMMFRPSDGRGLVILANSSNYQALAAVASAVFGDTPVS
jgi:CubicO group peptidase (beta-lactamase class C family)